MATSTPAVTTRRAASALRQLAHDLVGRELQKGQLRRIAETLEGLTASLADARPRPRDGAAALRHVYALDAVTDEALSHAPTCVVCGPDNPFALDLRYDLDTDQEEVRAILRLGSAHEGLPGRGNGAVIAAVFEDVLAHVLLFRQESGVTGSLRVDFLGPFPAPQEIRFTARVEGRDGRKIEAVATAHAQDELVGAARATLVTLPLQRLLPPNGPATD